MTGSLEFEVDNEGAGTSKRGRQTKDDAWMQRRSEMLSNRKIKRGAARHKVKLKVSGWEVKGPQ
jgi:hypothetical protein